MRNWRMVAKALLAGASGEDREKAAVSLERVEADFRPLAAQIPLETEPAYLLLLPDEES